MLDAEEDSVDEGTDMVALSPAVLEDRSKLVLMLWDVWMSEVTTLTLLLLSPATATAVVKVT